MLEETPTRPSRNFAARAQLYGKSLPLSPLINKSTNGRLGFLVVRKRRSLTTSSPRMTKKNQMNEDKENFDLDEDNLCSIASDNDDDEEDDVFSAVQEIIKKPLIKIDRSILKRKSPENVSGDTPRRTRRCLSLSSPPKSKILAKRDQEKLIRKRSKSVTEHNVPAIIDVPLDRRNLIGDFSKQHSLPIIPGKHTDLAYISSHTLAKVLKDPKKNVLIIDARYPYEFEGGHITTANNFYIQKEIDEFFFTEESIKQRQRSILVFHCEFSSERAPRQLRYLRACDRTRNPYPRLDYPEIYLLKGGYKEFYSTYKNMCHPEAYLPMLNDNYIKEYKLYRRKAKTIPVEDKFYT